MLGCTGHGDDQTRIQEAVKATNITLDNCVGATEPFITEHYVPQLFQAVDLLKSATIDSLDEPVLSVAALVDAPATQGHKDLFAIELIWFESGFRTTGFFIQQNGNEVYRSHRFIWTEKDEAFYARTVRRDNPFQFTFDEHLANTINSKRPDRLAILWLHKVDPSQPVQIGLLLDDGTKTVPIDAFVSDELKQRWLQLEK